jgi:hypothetical protein
MQSFMGLQDIGERNLPGAQEFEQSWQLFHSLFPFLGVVHGQNQVIEHGVLPGGCLFWDQFLSG